MTGQFLGGSKWRKWDLHIHSPLSLLNNQFPQKPGTPDWEAYIARLEATDLSVVGITDYFTIDGYKKIRDLKAAGRLKNIHTVLPNVEFRLSNVVASKKDGDKPRRLNFHVIFSDEIKPQDIEEHFLHNLDFYYEGSPQSPDQTRKLKVSNIETLGKKLIEENDQFRASGQTPLAIGAKTTVVNHEQISKILTRDSRFKDKYLLILPEELSSLIEWGGQYHIIRQGLLQKSDMVFSSNLRTRDWCLGLEPYNEGPSAFVDEFKSLKPCIHGSDAHKLDEIGKPCAKRGNPEHRCVSSSADCDMRYCWIKADPTFEGLKQLKYEPGDRVRIQELDPTPLKSNTCIKGFRMESATVTDELSLAAANLPLNEALVAVTGGKGAGKTAFVDILANHFKDRCNTEDANSFVRRVAIDNANFETAITFGDEALFKKTLASPQFVEQSEIVYIAQGELESYIGEDSDLDRRIRDLIFESPEIKNTVKAFEFEKLATKVRDLEEEIAQSNRNIQQLEDRTAEKVLTAAKREKTQFEAELRDVESKIPVLQSQLTKEKVEVVQKKQAARSRLQDRKVQLAELSELIANAKQFLSEDLSRFNLFISRINALLKKLDLQGSLANIEYKAAVDLDRTDVSVQKELRTVVTEIEAFQKELQGYEKGMQEHARYLNRRAELAAKLADTEKKIEAIASETKRLSTTRAKRASLFGDMLRTVAEQQEKYTEIIGAFSSQKAEVLSDLDFSPDIQFAREKLLTGLYDVLDNRQVEVFGTRDVPSQFQSLQEHYRRVCGGDVAEVQQVVDETLRLSEEMKAKVKKSQAISVTSLYTTLYGNYLTVVPTVTYKKTALSKLSLGQKATVLIKIYLAQGTNPIVIDSHDDHLDNEFIMEELVGAIRKAKTYRQVILASNNGNVVINSDAEQIVIADRQQGEISYTSGSIENPTIRDRALKVLEGGAEAFRKRQEKYRIGP